MAGPPARRQRAPKLSSTACRALSGWARRTSRAGLSCHLPLRTLARGCRRRCVVRPRVRGRSSSSGRAHYASGRALARPPQLRHRFGAGLRGCVPHRREPLDGHGLVAQREQLREASGGVHRRRGATRQCARVRRRPGQACRARPGVDRGVWPRSGRPTTRPRRSRRRGSTTSDHFPLLFLRGPHLDAHRVCILDEVPQDYFLALLTRSPADETIRT